MLVDEQCRTSDPHVYAIGECAAPGGRMYGLVAPGYAMAEVVADALLRRAAAPSPAPTCPPSSSCSASTWRRFGDAFATTDGALELVFADAVAGVYKKLVVDDDGTPPARRHPGRRRVGVRRAAADGRQRHRAARQPRGADPPGRPRAAPGVVGMPDEAVVCSCNNVTKGSIVRAIASTAARPAGRQDVHPGRHAPAAPACRWSRTCIEERLRRPAAEVVDKGLCEHFRLTRQELFDLVAVHGYRRFDDIVEAHGTRAAAATSASRRSRRSWPASSTRHVLDAGHRARCRTPTTPTSPTSSATAPTRWCRGSRAARSPPRS